MPWHQEAKKDGTNTEMLRGAVSKRRSGDVRMGKPNMWKTCYHLAISEARRRELKYLTYLQEKKVITIPLVVTSERGGARYLRLQNITIGERHGKVEHRG
jgi:hypothetical protein